MPAKGIQVAAHVDPESSGRELEGEEAFVGSELLVLAVQGYGAPHVHDEAADRLDALRRGDHGARKEPGDRAGGGAELTEEVLSDPGHAGPVYGCPRA